MLGPQLAMEKGPYFRIILPKLQGAPPSFLANVLYIFVLIYTNHEFACGTEMKLLALQPMHDSSKIRPIIDKGVYSQVRVGMIAVLGPNLIQASTSVAKVP